MDFFKRKFLLFLGWSIMAIALMLGPIPGPGGIPIFAAGAMLVLSQSLPARRFFIRMQRRYPNFLGKVRTVISRKEEGR